jgi:hypothetical protein
MTTTNGAGRWSRTSTIDDRGATSVQSWARQNPPLLRLKRAKQFAFRAHDTKFFRVDFDALGERAQVVATVPQPPCSVRMHLPADSGKSTCLVLLTQRSLHYRHGRVELIQPRFQFVVCLL